MNQAILFNDDLHFDKQHDAWSFTGQLSGQKVTIYFHSMQLKQLTEIDNCTKYDLEEVTELWLEKNEPEGNEIHIEMR
jgi:purine-nucleoside phosphorylase